MQPSTLPSRRMTGPAGLPTRRRPGRTGLSARLLTAERIRVIRIAAAGIALASAGVLAITSVAAAAAGRAVVGGVTSAPAALGQAGGPVQGSRMFMTWDAGRTWHKIRF